MGARYVAVSHNERELLNRSLVMSNCIITGHPQCQNQVGQCSGALGKDGQVV